MNTKSLLAQLLQSGQQLAERGRGVAEQKFDVPQQGAERNSMLSGLGKGALAGGLLTLLLGTRAGRRLGGSALKIGSLAALGGFAYNAYQKWQAGAGADQTAPDPGTSLDQLSGPQTDQRSVNLVKAMIAAAKADGHVDAEEAAKLKQQIQRFGLDDAALAALQTQMDKPLDPADIAAGADSPAAAAEIYLASLLVIDVDNPMERAYLQSLAEALELPDDLVAQIESEVGINSA